MTLATLRPLLAAVLPLAAGAALTWWGLAPRIDQQAARADHAEQAQKNAEQLVDLQAGVLEEQQRQIGQIAALEQQMRALDQTITRNATAQHRALEELQRNDQAIVDYLAAPVPAALGRLYQRPEATDPAAYRSEALLPTDPMPPAGAAAVGEQ